jgi:hypothetical protein
MSCTPPDAPGYRPGAVTLLFINTNTGNASILMYQQSRMQVSAAASADPWGPIPPPFNNLPRLDFVMTPADLTKRLLSRTVLLNGKPLDAGRAGRDAVLPSLAGLAATATTENFVVPAQSYGFAVYSEAAAPACSR